MKTREFKLLSSAEEYEVARRKLANYAFEEGIIQPRLREADRVAFKVMDDEHLDFVRRPPVYTDNRVTQSLPEVARLEVQLLIWLIEQHPCSFDRIAPVPDEANWLSADVSLLTGIPQITPRRTKGYGVQDEEPIDGRFSPGDVVVTIEGTTTIFGGILQTVKRFKRRKLLVPKAHAVFTYDWGKRKTLTEEGCEFEPILTVREAFKYGRSDNRVTLEEYEVVTDFLDRAEPFFRGEHTRERADEFGLLRAGF